MNEKEDILFYAGYGFTIVMMGLMILLFSLGLVDPWTAFGLWLLSTSLILVGLGTVKTESAPHGSRTMIGSGLLFALISIIILGIITDLVAPVTAIALFILVIGLGIVALGISRTRSAS